jgi:hypothetical protein
MVKPRGLLIVLFLFGLVALVVAVPLAFGAIYAFSGY